MDLNALVHAGNELVWGWPLIIFVIAGGVALTLVTRFAQFRYFVKGWQYVFAPVETAAGEEYITPFQAFLNMLNASVGNGSIAGMATALMLGGPGAAFWVFVLGFLYMVIRYAEIYLSMTIHQEIEPGVIRGGPMVYLQKLPAGRFFAYVYTLCVLALGFVTGNGMQCNSIRLAMERLFGIAPIFVAIMLFALILYIMLGGSKRIMKFTEVIVPLKVGLFFFATLSVLAYHYAAILPALKLIFWAGVSPAALAGGLVGFTIQQAMHHGMVFSLNATEAGLGTAGFFGGSIRGKEPVENSLMSMISAFVSNHLVCFLVALTLVASGVWNSGLKSTQMTMAGYETLFGTLGGAVIAFLSITFGIGVLVAYAYIGKECWRYLTGGRFEYLFLILYASMAFFGTLAAVELVWNATSIIVAALIFVNMLGILWLIKPIAQGLRKWENK